MRINGKILQCNMKETSNLNIDQLLKKASEHFMKREYQEALDTYLLVLQHNPTQKEALLGTMLCDMLQEDEEEAVALFEYYIVLKEEKTQNPEDVIIAMIKELDRDQEEIAKLFDMEKENILGIEGISYSDFMKIVHDRGSFREAFEDIMFSTKVIITKKSDFFDFLDRLIKNGFTDMVYSYLEDASKLYPTDKKLQEFVEKLENEKV